MTAFLGSFARGGEIRIDGAGFQRIEGRLVFARGHIAEREALAAALDLSGPNPGDAALFLAAYGRWGARLSHFVLGQYALVVVDEPAGAVLLTQDGFGVQPLYLHEGPGGLVFASHLQLLAERLPRLEIDRTYFEDHLRHARHLGARTPFAGVRRLMGGEGLELRGGALRRTAGRSLAPPAGRPALAGAETGEAFRDLLRRAVAATAPRGQIFWSELSGGLDSSSIACAAAELGLPFEAVSLIFSRTPGADERPWMRKVLGRHGLSWNTVDCEDHLPFSRWPARPFGEPNMSICTYAYSRAEHDLARARGIEVILSGGGGDQVLFGDHSRPVFFADLLLQGRLATLHRGLEAWRARSDPPRPYRFHLARDCVAPAVDHLLGRPVALGPLAASLPYLSAPTAGPAGPPARREASPGGVFARHYAARIASVSTMISHNVHQLRGARDMRYPLLYRPLVEFMSSLPPHAHLAPERDRLVQREALRGMLSEAVRTRFSKGTIEEPCAKGLAAFGPRLRVELTERSRLAHHGFVDADRWRRAVTLATHGLVEGLAAFMAAVSAEIWLQQMERAFAARAPGPPSPRSCAAILADWEDDDG